MITTIEVKAHLRDVMEIGEGPTSILILGSCRCVPYINYLNRCNLTKGDLYKIFVIEPNNYHWNEQYIPVNLEEELTKLETNERILSVLRSTKIFIHEHYANFGMFNTSKDELKNIYQFGINPDMDIAIPNWHDHMILENDYTAYGATAPDDYIEKGESEIEKFCAVCKLSSFPEFADYFRDNWRTTRFFWRPNHISSAFSIYIFRRMNSRFLNLTLTDDFWNTAKQEDLFSYPCTQVTQQDRDGYKITWRKT